MPPLNQGNNISHQFTNEPKPTKVFIYRLIRLSRIIKNDIFYKTLLTHISLSGESNSSILMMNDGYKNMINLTFKTYFTIMS